MATLSFYPSAHNSGWTNSQNGYANDALYATATPAKNASTVVQYGGFKIDSSIPWYAAINSVTLYVNWKVSVSGYAYDTLSAQVYVNGVAKGTAISTTSLSTTLATNSIVVTGLTMADLADASFKVYITATRGNTNTAFTASLNYTYVTVDYNATLNRTETAGVSVTNVNMKTSTLSLLAQKNKIISSFTSIGMANIAAYQNAKAGQMVKIQSSKLRADVNINTPIVPWSKNISSPTIGASVNININIRVEMKRIPPTMKASIVGMPCRDPHKGSIDNPYLITNLAELQALANKGGSNYSWYALANDIDGAGVTINPIKEFYGNLDGRGHTIKNLTIQQNPSEYYIGLFYILNGINQNIRNLNLDSITMTRSPSATVALSYAGFLFGVASQNYETLSISNINVTNCICASDLPQSLSVGGIVGYLTTKIYMTGCSVTGTTFVGNNIGGLIGCYGALDGLVQSCYTTGLVNGNPYYEISYVSGLIGLSASTNQKLTIKNCYSKMDFISSTSYKFKNVGGLIGHWYGTLKIINSYFSGHVSGYVYLPRGFIAYEYEANVNITNSYVDYQRMGVTDINWIHSGTPVATSLMKEAGLYGYWDFPWVINSDYNDGYPSFDFRATTPFKIAVLNGTSVNIPSNSIVAQVFHKGQDTTLYYDFGDSLPAGTTTTNYGIIDDPKLSGKGKVLSNTANIASSTCSAIIPITIDKYGIFCLEYMLSSETNCDYGRIYIDGIQIFNVSGSGGSIYTRTNVYGNNTLKSDKWSVYKFPLDAGVHTLKIEYYKDSSVDSGVDSFAIKRLYREQYAFYSDKSMITTELRTIPMETSIIGAGDTLEKKPLAMRSYLWPVLPVVSTYNEGVLQKYNATFTCTVPKMTTVTGRLNENEIGCHLGYSISAASFSAVSYGKSHNIKLDYILNALLSSADLSVYTNLDYFHIATTLLLSMGEDNQSIVIKW